MTKFGFCYQCQRQVNINNDLTCLECGSDFIELQERQTQENHIDHNHHHDKDSNPLSFFQTLFQGIQRNIPKIRSMYHDAANFLDQHSELNFDSPENFQAAMNLFVRLFPQLGGINSIFTDQNVSRIFQHLQNLNSIFHRNPPADQSVINSLTPQKYTNGICIDNTCAICLEDMKENEDVIILPCNHGFHQNCIGTWLSAHNVCPTCRQTL